MNPFCRDLRRALPAFLPLLVAATCHAGSIQLTPVRVNLSAAAKVAVLTVHNTGAEDSVMQVTLNKWTLDGQQYAYRQSQELVITPATFRLAPGKQQIIRIGLRDDLPQANEAAYRLLVEEVPGPPPPNFSGARLVVRHDVPVFVAPSGAARASLDVAVECAGSSARLRMANIGNVHAQLRHVAIESLADKKLLGSWDTFDYLLPNAQKSWPLAEAAPAAVGKRFMVTAHTDQGAFSADVTNTCP